MDNKELKTRREEEQDKIFNNVLNYLVTTDEGKEIVSKLEGKLSNEDLVKSIKLYSRICQKHNSETVIYCTDEPSDYRIETMIDNCGNVSYRKSIVNLLLDKDSNPGIRSVSYLPNASYALEQPCSIPIDISVIPFYAFKMLPEGWVNELVFFIPNK